MQVIKPSIHPSSVPVVVGSSATGEMSLGTRPTSSIAVSILYRADGCGTEGGGGKERGRDGCGVWGLLRGNRIVVGDYRSTRGPSLVIFPSLAACRDFRWRRRLFIVVVWRCVARRGRRQVVRVWDVWSRVVVCVEGRTGTGTGGGGGGGGQQSAKVLSQPWPWCWGFGTVQA